MQENRLLFVVTDTGVGIRPEALERIFLPYQQAEREANGGFGGIGLGLTICRELVRRMGGQIGVESQFGQGSRFWFDAHLPAVSSRPLRTLPELLGARILMLTANSGLVPADLAEGGGLLVAPSLLEAESALAQQEFDICLIDFEIGQWDFVREVVNLGRKHAVVVATSVGQRGDVALCKEIGVAGYLTAPLENVVLTTALALVLDPARQDIVTKYSAKEFISAHSGSSSP